MIMKILRKINYKMFNGVLLTGKSWAESIIIILAPNAENPLKFNKEGVFMSKIRKKKSTIDIMKRCEINGI